MGGLVFVHGIGVRALPEGGDHPYKATCRTILDGLFYRNIDWKLVECAWGDDLGAKLQANGKSFPPIDEALGPEAKPTDPARLWDLLLDDPMFELRALAALLEQQAEQAGAPPGEFPAADALRTALDNFVPTAELAQKLRKLDIEPLYMRAVVSIQNAAETGDAISHPEAFRAIARTIVATTLVFALAEGIPPPSLATLDELAEDTEVILREGQLGPIGDFARAAFVGVGSRLATRWGVGRRSSLPDTATPIPGDVIYYQAHGDRIRARIHETIANAPEPVALLAHSLGGIASLEAMCENANTRKRVKKFITAGSQSGFFYEIDALRTLPFGQPLPADFPDWLNFWDARDFLSFVTKDVFSGGASRKDIEIKSGLPFPASHSGYWRQPPTWEHIQLFLAK